MSAYPESVQFLRDVAALGQNPGMEDGTAGSVFTLGWCGIYVAALLEQNPTWTAASVGSWKCFEEEPEECSDMGDGICACMCDHFYAIDGDGWYYDIYGQHDPKALNEVTHHQVSDNALRCVLESWYDNSDADYALWARELASTAHFV